MRFYGWTETELATALAAANTKYGGNLCFGSKGERNTAPRRVGKALSFTLRVLDSRAKGARTSPRGRHMPNASWQAHFDFMVECFAILPTGRIKTMLADYRGFAEFMTLYEATGDRRVGWTGENFSVPVTLRECQA